MTTIKLHNTKTRKKEVFTPLDPSDVRMYVCGPTVYDRAHIGNARPVIVFDVLYRLLREVYGAENVRYARNFTDVDDKINATAVARKKAGAEGSLEELIRERTDETIAWYLEDMGALGNLEPDHAPRATEYIAEMVAMIEDLIADGHAYAAEGHVLFSVESYTAYGALSGRSVDDMIAGARVEVAPYKKNPMDFVLWKPSDEGLPGWDSPWGRGRPGWHIECSAMAEKLFGKRFDIHGGGNDLMFPHHENEIAQSCACNGADSFAQVWMHNEMLQVEGKKMSKSLGNFFSVRELIEQGYPGEVIRMVFLGTHYRKPMDWTKKKAEEARKDLEEWACFLSVRHDLLDAPLGDDEVDKGVVDALKDDLNTSLALTKLRALARSINNSSEFLELPDDEQLARERSFARSAEILGFDVLQMAREYRDREPVHNLESLVLNLAYERALAKETKDFSKVDALKRAYTEAGLEVRMAKEDIELVPTPDFDPKDLERLQNVAS